MANIEIPSEIIKTCKIAVEIYRQEGDTLHCDCYVDSYEPDVIEYDTTVDLQDFKEYAERNRYNYWISADGERSQRISFEDWFEYNEHDTRLHWALESYINQREGRTNDYDTVKSSLVSYSEITALAVTVLS